MAYVQKRYGNPQVIARIPRDHFRAIKGQARRVNGTTSDLLRDLIAQWFHGVNSEQCASAESIGPAIPATHDAYKGDGKAESIRVRLGMDESRKASSDAKNASYKD